MGIFTQMCLLETFKLKEHLNSNRITGIKLHIHSINYYLNAYYVPGAVLDAASIAINKTEENSL